MIMNHQHNHHHLPLRMMMQMIFMIHHHLQGLAEMCAGLSGMNKLLFAKATTHLLQLHVAITEAMAKVLCHLLEVVPVTQIVMEMELTMAMDVDKVFQDDPVVVAVVAEAEVKDCITIIVHSCSHMMMEWNILISSLVL